MKDDDVIAALRQARGTKPPVALADMVGDLADVPLTPASLVTFFSRAFPGVPLDVLLDARLWHRISDGRVTDTEFNEMMLPWLRV